MTHGAPLRAIRSAMLRPAETRLPWSFRWIDAAIARLTRHRRRLSIRRYSPVPGSVRSLNASVGRQRSRKGESVKAYVGITDTDWFELLRNRQDLEEVNFWQPGGSRRFRVLSVGELLLFKLHAPRNFIVGGGVFVHSSLLPISLAWASFGIANGVNSLEEMRRRVLGYRRTAVPDQHDFTVGCILLTQPFFLPEERWIPVPADWSGNIVQGKSYDLTLEPGASIYRALQTALQATEVRELDPVKYGTPTTIRPRLGQGSFRVLVTDAYGRRCSVTSEPVLPILEAAHIHPYSAGGEHALSNGLLLRSDLHTLFDRGYLTVTTDGHLEVSSRIREEFNNGHQFYDLHGKKLRSPSNPSYAPSTDNLRWHNENVYLG